MKKSIIIFAVFLFITNSILAQTDETCCLESMKEIPAGMNGIKGNFFEGYTWNDKNGVNYFIYTLTDERESSDYLTTQYMYCYHYKKTSSGFELIRTTTDFVKESGVEIHLGIFENGILITDIDQDGYAEITYIYRVGAAGDVSPLPVKLIMLENGEKYAIRGQETIAGRIYGDFPSVSDFDKNIDPSFNKAPKGFLEFAELVWGKFALNLGYY